MGWALYLSKAMLTFKATELNESIKVYYRQKKGKGCCSRLGGTEYFELRRKRGSGKTAAKKPTEKKEARIGWWPQSLAKCFGKETGTLLGDDAVQSEGTGLAAGQDRSCW